MRTHTHTHSHIGELKGAMKYWMADYLRGREMRTVGRDEKSELREVTSGVPQGSVLALIMFLIYINDMPDGVGSYISLFADDAKLLRKISTHKDCEALQHDLNRIYEWSKRWEMQFNVRKCHVMETGKSAMRPTWIYKMGNDISRSTEEKDLGVMLQDNLLPDKHINKIFGDTYKMLRTLRVAFHFLDKDMMKKIIATLTRQKLEYAETVWSPHKKKICEEIRKNIKNSNYDGARVKRPNL